jgi:hypothetical protein
MSRLKTHGIMWAVCLCVILLSFSFSRRAVDTATKILSKVPTFSIAMPEDGDDDGGVANATNHKLHAPFLQEDLGQESSRVVTVAPKKSPRKQKDTKRTARIVHNTTNQKARIKSNGARFYKTIKLVNHFPEMRSAANCSVTSPLFNQSFHLIKDHLSPLWWCSVHGVDASVQSDAQFWNRKLLIVIGDSLDRKMTNFACSLFNGTKTKEEPDREFAHPFVCVSPVITTVYLNIFGMDTACPNGRSRRVHDPRPFNSTAERISTLLPVLLGLLPPSKPPTDIFVQIGSNLWDLSQGCNNRTGIEEQYALRYRGGIRNAHQTLQNTLHSYYPSSKLWILWKMAPPLSQWFSDKRMIEGNHGMVRINQASLNAILKKEVGPTIRVSSTPIVERPLKLGEGIVDVWSHVESVSLSESDLDQEFEEDGYHYGKCASLSFFNLLLDVIAQLQGQ